ncbi:MAG: hypothetical protein C0487_05275 [Leptothrix sp. (in: Bacteria)]|nr:hypothetical protein [Leptothrix sp. (in: b-proteobacteria)]
MIINLPLKWSITSVRSHNRSEMLGGNSMKRHKFAWLLAAGVASLMVGACGGNDPDYGTPGTQVPEFVPGEGIAPPRFAYVVHTNDDSVSGYTVDPVDGKLSTMGAGTPWLTGSTPTCIAVDPLVKYAYVANSGSNNLSIFSIADPSGVLTSAALPVATGSQPRAVVVDPQGRYVYVANYGSNSISAFSRSTVTGLLTPITGSPFALPSSADIAPRSVAVDPSGKFVYVANYGATASPSTISMFTIDTASTGSLVPGALTAVGSIAAGSHPNQVTVSPSGRQVYVSNETGDSVMVYEVANALTGGLAYKGFVSTPGSTPTGIAIDPNNKFAYTSNRSDNTIRAYTIAPGGGSQGLLTAISGGGATVSTPANPGPTSVATDPSGKFVYATLLAGGGVAAYKINATTGVLTMVEDSPFNDGGATQSDFILITK